MAQGQASQYHHFSGSGDTGPQGHHIGTPQAFAEASTGETQFYFEPNALHNGLPYDNSQSYPSGAFFGGNDHVSYGYEAQPLDPAPGSGYTSFNPTYTNGGQHAQHDQHGQYPTPQPQAQYHDQYPEVIYSQGQSGVQQFHQHPHPGTAYQIPGHQENQFYIGGQDFQAQTTQQAQLGQQVQHGQQVQQVPQPQRVQQPQQQQPQQAAQQPQSTFQRQGPSPSFAYSGHPVANVNNVPHERIQPTVAQFGPPTHPSSQSPAPVASPSPSQFRRPSSNAMAPVSTFVTSTYQPQDAPQPQVQSGVSAGQSWPTGTPVSHVTSVPLSHPFMVATGPSPSPPITRPTARTTLAPTSRPAASRTAAALTPTAVQPPPAQPFVAAANVAVAKPTPLQPVSAQPLSAPPAAAQQVGQPASTLASTAPLVSSQAPPIPPESCHTVEKDLAVARLPCPRIAWTGMPNIVVGGNVPLAVSALPESVVLLDPHRGLGIQVMGREFPLPAERMKEFIILNENQANESDIDSRLNALETLLQKDYGLDLRADIRRVLRAKTLGKEEEPVRSKERPSDPTEAAAWDAIGIVYITDGRRDDSKIKQAVKNFGDLIKVFADKIKQLKQQLESAQTPQAEKERLKDALALEQKLMYRAVHAAYEKGNDQVLENLGSNRPLVANLVTALRDCYNSGDFTGHFPKAVLRLMSLFISLPEELLITRLKFDKIQKRFSIKGDEEVKTLIKEVAAIIATSKEGDSSDKDKLQNKQSSDGQPASGPAQGGKTSVEMKKVPSSSGVPLKLVKTARVPSDSSPSKRPRDDDSDTPISKKFAANSATGTPQPAAAKLSSSSAPAAATNTASSSAPKPFAPSALLPGKSRSSVVKPAGAPRSESTKSDGAANPPAPLKTELPKLQAQNAKPPVAKPEAAKPDAFKIPKKVPMPKAEPSQSSISRLGSLLNEIAQPKKLSQPTAKMDIDIESSETPEEKSRRLRKEERRKLRVAWKDGDELEQIRIFHKDAEEDDGRAASMIRHAMDDRSEGLMLKQGLQKGLDLDNEEDDELPDRPWSEPTPINFSSLPENKRKTSYANRGGLKAISTREREIMANRQMNELMVVYTDPSDIPPTPKSPIISAAETESVKQAIAAIHIPPNTPNIEEIHTRWLECEQLGPKQAAHNALMRLHHRASAILRPDASCHPTSSSAPLSEQVLALLKSDKVRNWVNPDPQDPAQPPKTQRRFDYPDSASQRASDAIEEISSHLKALPFPPTEPPSFITDPERVREWWHGYNRDKERRAQAAEQEKLRREAEALQAAQAAQVAAAVAVAPVAQAQQVPPQLNGAQPSQEEQAAAWAAYYAQIGQAYGPNPAAQTQAISAAQQQHSQYAQYAQYYQQQRQQPQVTNASQPPATDTNSQLQALLSALGGNTQTALASATLPAPAQPAAAANPPAALLDPQVQAILASAAASAVHGNPAQQAYLHQLTQWAASQQQPQQRSAGSTTLSLDGVSDSRDSGQNGTDYGSGGGSHDYGQGQGQGHAQQSSHRSHKSHGKEGGSYSRREKRLNPINRDLIGTKPCMFWASGKCAKGDKCTFRHE